MLPRPGATQALARFVAETRREELPDPVRHEAKRALLNFFAVAIAGCRTEPVEIALLSLAEMRRVAVRGSSSNPMKDTEIEDKLRAEAGRWRPGHDIQPLIDAVWALEKSADVSNLAALTVPR